MRVLERSLASMDCKWFQIQHIHTTSFEGNARNRHVGQMIHIREKTSNIGQKLFDTQNWMTRNLQSLDRENDWTCDPLTHWSISNQEPQQIRSCPLHLVVLDPFIKPNWVIDRIIISFPWSIKSRMWCGNPYWNWTIAWHEPQQWLDHECYSTRMVCLWFYHMTLDESSEVPKQGQKTCHDHSIDSLFLYS